MNNYKFSIEEILRKEIIVNAENADEAFNLVEELYKNEEIILDSSDFVEYKIVHIDNIEK